MEMIINSPKYGQHVIYYDEKDKEVIGKHNWSVWWSGYGFYAVTHIKRRSITMHRMLMGFPKQKVDHIDCNGLNNTRTNLRVVTDSQSSVNRRIQKNNKCGYKGVYYVKHVDKYRVTIGHGSGRKEGGYFDNIIDAAKRYNELAIAIYGEYANLNKIPNE